MDMQFETWLVFCGFDVADLSDDDYNSAWDAWYTSSCVY